jgi:hypothetical protein
MAAFLAHYQVLKSAASRSSDEQKLFAEMSAAIQLLAPEAQAALNSTEDTSSARRHRECAELQLRRALVARGIVAS